MKQVLLHVGRDAAGRRRLAEIAVLRRGGDGWVAAVTVWAAERGMTGEAGELRALLRGRVPA